MSSDSRPATSDSDSQLSIPWADVVRFVRQLSHDLRNNLNAIELQSAFIGELVENEEAKDEVKRLRAMASEMGAALQKVTVAMVPALLHPMPYKASDFVEDLRQKLASERAADAEDIEWEVEVGDAMLEIDPQQLQIAMLELFRNAFTHGRGTGNLRVAVNTRDRQLVFVLREPKNAFEQATEDWGARPLQKLAHGRYGLGLYRARSILGAHHGTLNARYDSAESTLVTTVELPLLDAGK